MLERLPEYWKTVSRGRRFHVRCVVRGPHEAAIDQAKDEVQRQGGDVLDHSAFSNLALNMIVELSGEGVLGLQDALAARGWDVEVEPARDALAPLGAERLEGTVQLTFPAGDGELRIPQPAVPG